MRDDVERGLLRGENKKRERGKALLSFLGLSP
jgi:hypothetical protein